MYGIWLGPHRDCTQNHPQTGHFGKIQIFALKAIFVNRAYVALRMTTILNSLVGLKNTFFV